MFNFTTQTVLNSVVLTTESDIRDKKAPKGYNVITKDTAKGPEVRFGNIRFNKDDVLDIQFKNHSPESLAKVTFDLAQAISLVTADSKDVQEGSYRIALYIGLSMNAQDAYYSNAFVYKGKPVFIEFPITATDTAETAAKRLVKIVNKYMLLIVQERILNVSEDEGKVIFEGINGYQLIKKAVLEKYDPNAKQIDCCNTNGDYVEVMHGVPVTYEVDAATGEVTVGDKVLDFDGLRDLEDNEVAIEPGIEAFGDYNWIIHNLRLPTAANTNFWAVTKNEMPIPGGNYVQFIVRMCVDRDGIAGQVVGMRATSVTTHVFYVLDQGDNVETFKTELAKLATIKTDADDALADPFANAQ